MGFSVIEKSAGKGHIKGISAVPFAFIVIVFVDCSGEDFVYIGIFKTIPEFNTLLIIIIIEKFEIHDICGFVVVIVISSPFTANKFVESIEIIKIYFISGKIRPKWKKMEESGKKWGKMWWMSKMKEF